MDPSPPPHSLFWSVNKDVRLLRGHEREKAEQEKERLEKLRGAEQAVDKHFEESLRPQRLAQHKNRSSSWNVPSFPTNTRVVEDPVRMRDRYFPPPPSTHQAPAPHPHSRVIITTEPPSPQTSYNMFGFPGISLPVGMMKQEPIHPASVKLPTPPPVISDVKNSVIVKNDIKKRERADIYRTSPSLMIEAQNLQRPIYPTYSHAPGPKTKVSSPAPAHIYGKPSSKPSLSTSPYQQMPTHHPPPISTKLPPPPPAHSSVASSVFLSNSDNSLLQPLPLDLGTSLNKTEFPKRKMESPIEENDVSPSKKTCLPIPVEYESIPLQHEQEPLPLAFRNPTCNITEESNFPTNLSSESPSFASNNTTPPSGPSNITDTINTNISNLSSDTVSPTSGNSVNISNNSNSAGVNKQEGGVHKLKKAWLQRHSGVESTTPPPATPTPPPAITPPATPTPPLQQPSITNVGSPASSVRSTPPLQPTSSNLGSPGTPFRSTSPSSYVASTPPAPSSNINGHASLFEESSSSDSESSKRVPAKVKKKNKTAKKSVSSTESDEESDSKSDSGGKKANGGGLTKSVRRSNKRKGKKNKDSSVGNSPRWEDNDSVSKRKTRNVNNPRDPFQKPPISQLKRTGESFLQDGPCYEVAPKLTKCRECRWTPNERYGKNANIFCRFYAFRHLRYSKNSQLASAGFSDPHKDATPEDECLWIPDSSNPPTDIDLELSETIIRQVANQFFELLDQEKKALELNMADDGFIAWKRVVQGVREMCDVCETTLFNFHWTCRKCGFVVCIDCYQDRKNGRNKSSTIEEDKDEASWLLCNNSRRHEQDKLMLTQIIAGDSLRILGEKLKVYQENNNIPVLTEVEKHIHNHNMLAEKNSKSKSSVVSTEVIKKEDEIIAEQPKACSTLRKLLIHPSGSQEKTSKICGSHESASTGHESSEISTLVKTEHSTSENEDPCSAPEGSSETDLTTVSNLKKEEIEHSEDSEILLKYYKANKFRRWKMPTKETRIFNLTESMRLYPHVPHSWLGDGKLLRLTDPQYSDNILLFEEMWRRGQPVLVSSVGAQLDKRLWHPESFAKDFCDLHLDLINCVTGNVVPNQSMRAFWEGFEMCSKRLKDDKGEEMLLKVKDWPPSEDFAEISPNRFSDLMKVLPLGEYTQRTGRLNLASRLPECFVKPDLGPKMYIAYGNTLYPSKATTNLHLDISDAVNLMVYVGIPRDGDHNEYMRAAFRAIDEGGCDILTKRRVRTAGELPGALWHIFSPQDADKIRDCLNKVAIEKGAVLEKNHDPIHDQSWYIDQALRDRLYSEYYVKTYTVVQCLGDAVFVPAGAPHQVRNLHSCIKIAEDFVSPENVSHCFHLTQEFRGLSETHSNHEDKLQIKNIIYHAVKDALSVIEADKLKQKNNSDSGTKDVLTSTEGETS